MICTISPVEWRESGPGGGRRGSHLLEPAKREGPTSFAESFSSLGADAISSLSAGDVSGYEKFLDGLGLASWLGKQAAREIEVRFALTATDLREKDGADNLR